MLVTFCFCFRIKCVSHKGKTSLGVFFLNSSAIFTVKSRLNSVMIEQVRAHKQALKNELLPSASNLFSSESQFPPLNFKEN
jgi:hypothetical protein